MVNFWVWLLLVVNTGSYADEASETRFVEIIIHDLEKSQFLHKIEDKVILFPNQLKDQLRFPEPETEPETESENKSRIRRAPKRRWTAAQISAKVSFNEKQLLEL